MVAARAAQHTLRTWRTTSAMKAVSLMCAGTRTMALAAGDLVTLRVQHTSAAARNVAIGSQMFVRYMGRN